MEIIYDFQWFFVIILKNVKIFLGVEIRRLFWKLIMLFEIVGIVWQGVQKDRIRNVILLNKLLSYNYIFFNNEFNLIL